MWFLAGPVVLDWRPAVDSTPNLAREVGIACEKSDFLYNKKFVSIVTHQNQLSWTINTDAIFRSQYGPSS